MKTSSCSAVAACFLMASSLGAPGCSPTGSFKVSAVPSDQSLQERIVLREPGWVSNRIAIIDISGILMNAREFELFGEGEHPVSFIVEQLNAAAADGRVKAVVLRINSPGGTVTASDSLYEEIKSFRKETGKPVIAYFQDVAASGAYYAACAADEIVAQRTSVTGSIGVVMQMVDFSGTMSKLGIRSDAIKSGAFKDSGSPLRVMRPEEREIFQGIVDSFYQQFVDVVATGRPNLSREEVVTLADGRVYTAKQALAAGLIDRIATLRETLDLAKERAGIEAAHAVVYHRPLGWVSTIYAREAQNLPHTINLLNLNLPSHWTRSPRFLYTWCPED